MKRKKESEKAGLKLNSLKAKIIATSPNSSCQIDKKKVEAMTDFFSWAPKSLWMVTSPMKLKDVCSLELKL